MFPLEIKDRSDTVYMGVEENMNYCAFAPHILKEILGNYLNSYF